MSVQRARRRMDSAWVVLQNAQREYVSASDAWMDAVAASARDGVSEEKGRGEVGPHTHARNTQGYKPTHGAHDSTHGVTATLDATHATQPTQPQALDTTSHG